MEREYVVTLHNYDDLDSFYEEMESQGNVSEHYSRVPERAVDCALRRSISRNTHYLLTDEEAENLRKDRRVLAVELLPSELGLVVTPHWTQTATFQKSSVGITSTQKNWGLRRCIGELGNPASVNGWSYPIATGGSSTSTATIKTTSSGKNVDVVIVDAHINPNHPEFAVNDDGTGGSRVNLFNWFQYSSALGYNSSGSYSYANISSNHGTHVAGTVAGNTQGWARDANIYNMEFSYAGAITSGAPAAGQIVTADWTLYIFDYLRHFHKNKPINATTGRRNPTITNHSWGYSYNSINLTSITSVTYRGTTTTLSGTSAERKTTLEARGVPVPFNTFLHATPARVAALDADIQDAINDGVVVISSAGNSYWKMDVAGGTDYNNAILVGSTIYHTRGSSPGSADNVICVGSLGSDPDLEQKSNFSNCGPRVNVYAPGSNIISSVYDSTAASEFSITLANDPRSSSFRIGSISGTSMASPQVTGAIACLAEQYPRINNEFALRYLIENSQSAVNQGVGINTSPYRNTQGSPNRLLVYKQERLIPDSIKPSTLDPYGSVVTQPRDRYDTRSASRLKYPRRNTLFGIGTA